MKKIKIKVKVERPILISTDDLISGHKKTRMALNSLSDKNFTVENFNVLNDKNKKLTSVKFNKNNILNYIRGEKDFALRGIYMNTSFGLIRKEGKVHFIIFIPVENIFYGSSPLTIKHFTGVSTTSSDNIYNIVETLKICFAEGSGESFYEDVDLDAEKTLIETLNLIRALVGWDKKFKNGELKLC